MLLLPTAFMPALSGAGSIFTTTVVGVCAGTAAEPTAKLLLPSGGVGEPLVASPVLESAALFSTLKPFVGLPSVASELSSESIVERHAMSVLETGEVLEAEEEERVSARNRCFPALFSSISKRCWNAFVFAAALGGLAIAPCGRGE